jgi:His-Xaa-Ser system protein HxsD
VKAVEIVVDADSHPADAIQRAAYKFADRFTIELTRDKSNYVCRLNSETGPDESDVDAFRTEIVDQVLRDRIRRETEGIRNLVLSLAFSRTGLSDGPDLS